jgi:hypothetical protein
LGSLHLALPSFYLPLVLILVGGIIFDRFGQEIRQVFMVFLESFLEIRVFAVHFPQTPDSFI